MPRKRLLIVIALTLLLASCGDENPGDPVVPFDDPVATVDTIPPAAIEGLLVKSITQRSVALVWIAPGDDGKEGIASEYDIRFSLAPFDEDSWNLADQVEDEPAPRAAGQPETVRVLRLKSVTTYHFGIKTRDEAGNESGLSEVVSGTTLQEIQPPAPVTDLWAESVAEDAFELSWTAPGDDGVYGRASAYQIRHSRDPINESNWNRATIVQSPPEPGEPGTSEVFRAEGLYGLRNYYFAIRTADEVPNWALLSNVAFAIGGRVELYITSDDMYSGQRLEIYWRAPGDQPVSVHLHRWAVDQMCSPAGTHPWVYADLVRSGVYAAGLYKTTCNFTYPNGSFMPTGNYFVVVCWGGMAQTQRSVSFTNDP